MKRKFILMTAGIFAAAPFVVSAQSNTTTSGGATAGNSSVSSAAASGNAANRYGGMRDSQNWERSHRVSKIIGTDVVNRQGDQIGDVEDIVLDNRGNVAYAVVSTGGFLGVGERWHAVPWRSLNTAGESGKFVLDIDRNRLSEAPGFTRDNWPNVNDPKWTSQNSRYFGNGRGAASGAGGNGAGTSGGMSGGSDSGSGMNGMKGMNGMNGMNGTSGTSGTNTPPSGSNSGSGTTSGGATR
jgi:sporulation protein YlmC with PRC-barrel domain